MTTREKLNSIAKERVLILDGAMGSMILALNLSEDDYRGGRFANHPMPLKGCNDLLCITKPEAIGAIHDAYLEAGADIIETCSFNSTSISLSDYGIGEMAYEISVEAAKIARNAADKFSGYGTPRFVAGSMGPTAKGASLYPDINDPTKRGIGWDELEAAYYDNARGLLDGGADILLVETVFDTLNAKAALFAISRLLEERKAGVPVMISASVSGESGQLLSGQNLEAFVISVLHASPFEKGAPWAVGLNCSFGAKKLLPFIRRLSKIVPCLVSAYPNAGLPNQSGNYDETAEIMSANIEEYLKEGLVNIAGGCCGSTPSHIAAIAKTARNYKPRELPEVTRHGLFAGLEPLYVSDNIIHIGDTVSAANIKEFLNLLDKGEYEDAVDVARDMVDNGATIVEVKTDDKDVMGKFLDYALMNPYVAKAPFFLNSSCFDVLEAALKRLQGRGLAGPVNLKDGDAEFLRKAALIRKYGAAALVTLVDEEGQAKTDARNVDISCRICSLLRISTYPVENIVFHLPEMMKDNSIYLWIRNNCPGALIAL